jgi:hypothetical protein
MDRYVRQRQLAAVGDGGQARIAQATFVVASGEPLARQIEREYLARAGVQHFAETPASVPATEFAHAAVFRHAAARDFAQGAWRALAQLRSTLEPSP